MDRASPRPFGPQFFRKKFCLEITFNIEHSLTLPGLARRSDKPSAALSGRRPRGGRWEEAAHRQGRNYNLPFQKDNLNEIGPQPLRAR
eukprot:4793362-Pyramimonas_sp.AAC.1